MWRETGEWQADVFNDLSEPYSVVLIFSRIQLSIDFLVAYELDYGLMGFLYTVVFFLEVVTANLDDAGQVFSLQ